MSEAYGSDSSQARVLALIGAPSSAGARLGGQEDGPAALRTAGLVECLREAGATVIDRGDLAKVAYRPDSAHPRQQNVDLVEEVATAVAEAVRATVEDGALPVVLGGDCTVTLGVVAGLSNRAGNLGVVYFDGDLDLNTPETTPSGILDGMVAAHLIGAGHPALTGLGRMGPLLRDSHLVFLGYNTHDGGIDPAEVEALTRSRAGRISIEEVRLDPVGAARAALRALDERAERVLVHFDFDVTDSPAVDVRHPHGLSLAAAGDALEVLLASPKLAGLVFTEFNPRRATAGSPAPAIVERLVSALSATCMGAVESVP